jgi:hypothetical protein
MRLKGILIGGVVAVALAFVPAFPLTYLGETSWLPAWRVYPFLFEYLREASTHRHLIAICFVFILGHLGLSLAVGATMGMLFFRQKD